jgi:hypothetical protein
MGWRVARLGEADRVTAMRRTASDRCSAPCSPPSWRLVPLSVLPAFLSADLIQHLCIKMIKGRRVAASFLKHHEAAIVSFAAGAAVFAGCMVITEGVAAVGSLVSYGMSCGSAAGGCSAEGALVSAGIGALGGAVGGALAGPLGRKLASSVLGDVLPALAVQGLTGATAGAAAGGAAGAAAYGLGLPVQHGGLHLDRPGRRHRPNRRRRSPHRRSLRRRRRSPLLSSSTR